MAGSSAQVKVCARPMQRMATGKRLPACRFQTSGTCEVDLEVGRELGAFIKMPWGLTLGEGSPCRTGRGLFLRLSGHGVTCLAVCASSFPHFRKSLQGVVRLPGNNSNTWVRTYKRCARPTLLHSTLPPHSSPLQRVCVSSRLTLLFRTCTLESRYVWHVCVRAPCSFLMPFLFAFCLLVCNPSTLHR